MIDWVPGHSKRLSDFRCPLERVDRIEVRSDIVNRFVLVAKHFESSGAYSGSGITKGCDRATGGGWRSGGREP